MMHAKHNEQRRSKAADILSAHGYGKMKHLATEAVHEHEGHDHKGEKKTKLKLANGGCAMGGAPHARMDRKPRAAGGRNKHKEPHVAVNVINAGKTPVPMPMPAGGMGTPPRPPMMPSPQATPPMAPQRPPMMPPQGAPMAGGMPRPPMMNRGGRLRRSGGGPVKNKTIEIPHLEGGSGGGLGRLEKGEAQAKRKSA